MNDLMEKELQQIDTFAHKEETLMFENGNGKCVVECECWTFEKMKSFIEFMKTTYEGPLLKQLEDLIDTF